MQPVGFLLLFGVGCGWVSNTFTADDDDDSTARQLLRGGKCRKSDQSEVGGRTSVGCRHRLRNASSCRLNDLDFPADGWVLLDARREGRWVGVAASRAL